MLHLVCSYGDSVGSCTPQSTTRTTPLTAVSVLLLYCTSTCLSSSYSSSATMLYVRSIHFCQFITTYKYFEVLCGVTPELLAPLTLLAWRCRITGTINSLFMHTFPKKQYPCVLLCLDSLHRTTAEHRAFIVVAIAPTIRGMSPAHLACMLAITVLPKELSIVATMGCWADERLFFLQRRRSYLWVKFPPQNRGRWRGKK